MPVPAGPPAGHAPARGSAGDAASPYATLTPHPLITNGALTLPRAKKPDVTFRRNLMLDLLYIALGLAGFAAFALIVRAAERM